MKLQIIRQCACNLELDIHLRRKHLGLKGLFLGVRAPTPKDWDETCFLYQSSPHGNLYSARELQEVPAEMMPDLDSQWLCRQWIRRHALMLQQDFYQFLHTNRIVLILCENGEIEARGNYQGLIEPDSVSFIALCQIIRRRSATMEIKKDENETT